jgi:bifunctional DNA-binding transcriptional regulator/antitoxin component of YhaV-PrlF toxin-antitoxin module
MVKIQQLKRGQLVVCIPREIARFKGWKKGDELIFKEDKNTMRVTLINKNEP